MRVLSCGNRACGNLLNGRIFPWVFEERRPAAVAAEIVRNAGVIFDVQRIGAAHGHSADGIDEYAACRCGAGLRVRNRLDSVRACSRSRLVLDGLTSTAQRCQYSGDRHQCDLAWRLRAGIRARGGLQARKLCLVEPAHLHHGAQSVRLSPACNHEYLPGRTAQGGLQGFLITLPLGRDQNDGRVIRAVGEPDPQALRKESRLIRRGRVPEYSCRLISGTP